MNIQECNILNILLAKPFVNQRTLAQESGHSLGVVNRSVRGLLQQGYLDDEMRPTGKAREAMDACAPKNAIILAAGFGMRMIPLNSEIPKGLIEIGGEPLIERLIKQLHQAGIHKISVVVGFMKEHYEYLIDEYGVELLVNAEYAAKNNLHSLKLALGQLSNTYIIPCDVWCKETPFHAHELYSWYMVSDQVDPDSSVRVNRKLELVSVKDTGGNSMIGICYLTHQDADAVQEAVTRLCAVPRYDSAFWEEALFRNGRMLVSAKVIPAADVFEINTYEQLREIDSDSNQLKTFAIQTIAEALDVNTEEITDIAMLKKGMTNRSFSFVCRGKQYIMRIPGEGTEQLINRAEEAAVYQAIRDLHICDDIVYINPENGYKISVFLKDARVCDPLSPEDVKKCMRRLRSFHELGLRVEHSFEIFKLLEFYETLWNGVPSVYKDYKETKRRVLSLVPFIEAHKAAPVLSHIDAVPDNFLFSTDDSGQEDLRMIDWEYAGMHDPHIDIAMFCIYALYDREQVDTLIDAYFTEGCDHTTRIKIYCYIAACGLLWSNWCEYKRQLGVEFGAYSLRQYRYAKDYYKIVQAELQAQDGGASCAE